uniref:Uncharacterized protein n=1 Tax=Chenopodium quinoa TaxID=63459 RepID=A0A803NAY0_CHEQI
MNADLAYSPLVEVSTDTSSFFVSRALQYRKQDYKSLTQLEKQQADFLFFDTYQEDKVLEIDPSQQGIAKNKELEVEASFDTMAEFGVTESEIWITKDVVKQHERIQNKEAYHKTKKVVEEIFDGMYKTDHAAYLDAKVNWEQEEKTWKIEDCSSKEVKEGIKGWCMKFPDINFRNLDLQQVAEFPDNAAANDRRKNASQRSQPKRAGGLLKTHTFLQPLEGEEKSGTKEDNLVDINVKPPSAAPPTSVVEHVLPGGIGTYSISHISYFNPRVPKPEENIS